MKDILKILAVVVVSVIAGAYASRCSTEILRRPDALHLNETASRECVIDTIPYYDTIRYYLPQAKAEVSLGTQIKFMPVFIPKDSTNSGLRPHTSQNQTGEGVDSIEVEIPITQREYRGEDYHAWVSGYEPRLDSIFVFPRHEVVTIRETPDKKKRWHIGPAIGFGYTPQGIQPYLGIGITYSIISF